MRTFIVLALLLLAGCTTTNSGTQSAGGEPELLDGALFNHTSTPAFYYVEFEATAEGAVVAIQLPLNDMDIRLNEGVWAIPVLNGNPIDMLGFLTHVDETANIEGLFLAVEADGDDELTAEFENAGAWHMWTSRDENLGLLVGARGVGTVGLILTADRDVNWGTTADEYLADKPLGAMQAPIARGSGVAVGLYFQFNGVQVQQKVQTDDIIVNDVLLAPTEPVATIRNTMFHQSMAAANGTAFMGFNYFTISGHAIADYDLQAFGQQMTGTATMQSTPQTTDYISLFTIGSGNGTMSFQTQLQAESVNLAENIVAVSIGLGLSTEAAFGLPLSFDAMASEQGGQRFMDQFVVN